jgi:hypothetical protein
MRGKKKPAPLGSGPGSYAKTLAYPVAPEELARLMRTATGVSFARFMERIIMHCGECVKRATLLTAAGGAG